MGPAAGSAPHPIRQALAEFLHIHGFELAHLEVLQDGAIHIEAAPRGTVDIPRDEIPDHSYDFDPDRLMRQPDSTRITGVPDGLPVGIEITRE